MATAKSRALHARSLSWREADDDEREGHCWIIRLASRRNRTTRATLNALDECWAA
jgi:hypothetical protein